MEEPIDPSRGMVCAFASMTLFVHGLAASERIVGILQEIGRAV
jgi:hypothetical protein